MADTDPLSAALKKMRARLDDASMYEDWHRAGREYRRALAAVEAVLNLHRPVPGDWGTMCSCWTRGGSRSVWPCAELRAITRELLREEAPGGQ